jgi:hypothetical protein
MSDLSQLLDDDTFSRLSPDQTEHLASLVNSAKLTPLSGSPQVEASLKQALKSAATALTKGQNQ